MGIKLKPVVLTLSIFLIFSSVYSNEPITLVRFPAPSPEGKHLTFSWQGDIWTVPIEGGSAHRLTIHEAYESHPNWSPDGKELAFSSARNGNDDIYVMQSDGTLPVQLTYFSGNDQMCDWSPDGKSLIFSSLRDFYYHRLQCIYQVDRKGGTPSLIMPEYGTQGKISPDGKWLAYVEGRNPRFRKHYHGSGNTDIWLYNFDDKTYRRLTTHEGNDLFPLWAPDSKSIYYVSDEDGTFNIWHSDLTSSHKTQLTFHKEDGVRFANISFKQPIIAYEQDTFVWILNASTGKSEKLEIFAPKDQRIDTIERKTFASDATEIALSPDEKFIALVVRGEIYVIKNREEGSSKAVQLTESPARECDICWTPNGDTLLFASDRNGNQDIFMLVSDDTSEKKLYHALKLKILQLTASPQDECSPRISPDGKKIAFIRADDLWVMNRDGKQAEQLVESWDSPDFSWSPDSKWIAYSVNDNEFNSDIFIISADGGKPVNITRHPDIDEHPVWSKDGRKLAFTAKRSNDTFDVWFVFLQKKDHEMTPEDWENAEDREKDKKKSGDKKEKTRQNIVVTIDFNDIHQRLRRVTSLPGDEQGVAISPDGKTFAFQCNTNGKNDLWVVDWNGKDLKQLADKGENPAQIQWTSDGKNLFYLKKGGIIATITKDGKSSKTKSFQAKMKIDRLAERMQMFDEAWQILNHEFYDPQFHGADWRAMHEKYRRMIEQVALADDWYDVVRMMLGELNASHLGINPPGTKGGVQTGMLGLRFDETYAGSGLKISSVIPEGSCDQAEAKVEPGEILKAIDGISVTKQTNIYELLNDKVGEKVILSLEKMNARRELIVRPISFSEFRQLEYKRWVEQKREAVAALSHNKLGYLHIQGMGWGNFEQFEMELYSEAHGKDALIIDVRNNGGGWITDYLLAILQVKPHAYTIPRNGGKGYPQSRRPFYAWDKPVAVLCNQYSYSNAEIFSHAIKVLRRGKLVGVPTPGAVISTGGTQLIDGSYLRIPFRGWYNLETGLDQELNGAIPDFIIPMEPGDIAQNKDRQLEKAVEILMSEKSH
ncbi:PD40 domain-containing protein [candidate division KSB1 bacterium]|nr:PD40 domain-containing protein [candidate division KSB1 bacterium]